MPEFIDAHGIAIVYDVHPAKTTPRAVVQLAARRTASTPAGTTHSSTPSPRDGYTVYADDHRGHGRTGMAAARRRCRQARPARTRGRPRGGRMPSWQMTEIIRAENPDAAARAPRRTRGDRSSRRCCSTGIPTAYDAVVLSGTVLRQLGLGKPRRPEQAMGGSGRDGHGVAQPRPGGGAGVPRRSADHDGADGARSSAWSTSCG